MNNVYNEFCDICASYFKPNDGGQEVEHKGSRCRNCDVCASCFKPYDNDWFQEGAHILHRGWNCGHSSCGYDVQGKWIDGCFFPNCIKKREQTKIEKKEKPKEKCGLSEKDEQMFTSSLKALIDKFSLQNKNIDNIDDFKQLAKDFHKLLLEVLEVLNKDKGEFAMWSQHEIFENILMNTVNSAMSECGYEHSKQDAKKNRYVNTKLIEKLIELFRDNGFDI